MNLNLGLFVTPARLKNTCGMKHCANPDHWAKDGKS